MPLAQLLDGRPAGRVVAFIHRRQQTDVLRVVAARKTLHGALTALECPGLAVLLGELLAGVAADLHQVVDHHTLSPAGSAPDTGT